MKRVIILFLLIIGGSLAVGYAVKKCWYDTYLVTGTVLNKHDKVVGSEGETRTHYMVTLTDGTVLEVNRNWFHLSPETQQDRVFGSIQLNKTYQFTCWGLWVEWAFISWYPKIIAIEDEE